MRCGSANLCPEGMLCLPDGYCHNSVTEASCSGDAAANDGDAPAVQVSDAVVDVMRFSDAPVFDAPAVCMVGGSDDACVICVKERCCTELATCLEDSVCACWVECYIANGGSSTCAGPCGPPNGIVAILDTCRSYECGGSTCPL